MRHQANEKGERIDREREKKLRAKKEVGEQQWEKGKEGKMIDWRKKQDRKRRRKVG